MVMLHPDLVKHYPEESQMWVPCVKATSVSLFLDTIHCLGGHPELGGHLERCFVRLKSSQHPLILLLDNFETPWNIPGGRGEMQQILHEIDSLRHVTLFLTMRASTSPGVDLKWFSLDIRAVDESAARRIYSGIYPASAQDTELPELVQTLICELRPDEDSPFELLATLTMLPVGTTFDALKKWWAPDMRNRPVALQTLRDASLVEFRGADMYVLPVIRSYVLDEARFPKGVRNATLGAAIHFLVSHDSKPGHTTYKDDNTAIGVEEGNPQAILLDTTQDDVPIPDLIEALVILSRFQLQTRPRMEMVEHTVRLAHKLEPHNRLLWGGAQSLHGAMFLNLHKYDEAAKQYKAARETYIMMGSKKEAANATLDITQAHSFVLGGADEDETALREAQAVFEELDDDFGLARTYHHIGIKKANKGMYSDAEEICALARDMFAGLDEVSYHADSTSLLGVYAFLQRDYEKAHEIGEIAMKEFEELGRYVRP
ncbi:hypothetical protein DXG03_005823 [Asterophora parasitica]|uniref:Uncharacterized protein n=1 Tax=Asterophora parasitica TaxID=117018 RepID=A0A9P7G8N4_9AGAR|nr:hypothetical protein DXG03_005823 [Asterophora parasitica]